MNQLATNLLGQRRKRLVGSLMDYLEKHVYPHLPEAQRGELRNKVLAEINAYHDVTLDLIKASVSDGSIVNDEALLVLTRLENSVTQLTRAAR